MENRYKINYDIKKTNIIDVNFKQWDVDSSVLDIMLLDNEKAIDITDEAITFIFLRSDGTIVYQDSTSGVNIINSTIGNVECILASNTLACEGTVECEINRVKDGKELTTQRFIFNVEASIGDGGILSIN